MSGDGFLQSFWELGVTSTAWPISLGKFTTAGIWGETAVSDSRGAELLHPSCFVCAMLDLALASLLTRCGHGTSKGLPWVQRHMVPSTKMEPSLNLLSYQVSWTRPAKLFMEQAAVYYECL